MTVFALIASALGGGIVASLLESWFASFRAYEVARLRVLDALSTIEAMSLAMVSVGRDHFTQEEWARLAYPTNVWAESQAAMLTRLNRDHPNLLDRLTALVAALGNSPTIRPLAGQMAEDLRGILTELLNAGPGILGSLVVYGPRTALEEARASLRTGKSEPPPVVSTTGSQNG